MAGPDIDHSATFVDHGDGTRHLRREGESFFVWQARRLGNTRTFASLDQESAESQMNRVLGIKDLSALGVGAIIGTGIFVLTGKSNLFKRQRDVSCLLDSRYSYTLLCLRKTNLSFPGVVANDKAGPAVVISFIIASIVAGLAALSYAEMACLVPIAGSAYTYTYATCGELMAWIIGWDLILEYLVGAATVSVGFSHYLGAFFEDAFGWKADPKWMNAPFQYKSDKFDLTSNYFSVPSFVIVVILTILLCRGIRSSTRVNNVLVIIKLIVILVFIFGAASSVNTDNYKPFIPPNEGSFGKFGGSGVLRGATVVFFAFIGKLSCTTQNRDFSRFSWEHACKKTKAKIKHRPLMHFSFAFFHHSQQVSMPSVPLPRRPATPSAICPSLLVFLWSDALSCTLLLLLS